MFVQEMASMISLKTTPLFTNPPGFVSLLGQERKIRVSLNIVHVLQSGNSAIK